MTAAMLAISIVLIVISGITASILSFFRLQRHRSDAVAMASYRKLAEQAVQNQEELRARLAGVDAQLTEILQVLRSVE